MIRETFRKHLGDEGYRVFIFGSQANLPELKRSDIDVGIEGKEEYNYSLIFKIKEELNELKTLYWFDLVDFNNVNEKFKKLATKNIELL